MNNTCRNGPQTAPNSHANRQHHSPWSREQQHTTTMHQSHGHEISLAMMPRGPTPIPILLAPRPHQQGRLLDQASLRSPPHQKAPRNLNPQDLTGRPTCISEAPRNSNPQDCTQSNAPLTSNYSPYQASNPHNLHQQQPPHKFYHSTT
jgi:hypothetical protein